MTTIDGVLQYIREKSETEKDKGTRYERLVRYFLLNDPLWSTRLDNVWMIDRYQVKTDKASGITNDPNLYNDDPLYIPNLVRRLITVSVQTMEIIDTLPPLADNISLE